jgi:hypothetical protein
MTGPVIVLHTTEGSTIAGAVTTMKRNRSECHEVVDLSLIAGNGWITQLLTSWDAPARSLRHPRGPETNNRQPPVYQIEIVGFAARVTSYSAGWYANLAAYLDERCRRLGVSKSFPCVFRGENAYGINASQRLSWGEWATVEGIIGHQHVPGNSHWDPGRIDRVIPLINQGDPMPADPFVTEVQQLLADAGFDPGPIDGIPGPRLVAAAHAMKNDRLAKIARIAELEAGNVPPDDTADTVLGRELRAVLRSVTLLLQRVDDIEDAT